MTYVPTWRDPEHRAELNIHEQTARVELFYPPYDDDPPSDRLRYVEVDMCAVRATDGVRLWYSFTRNGWVIEQAQRFSWAQGEPIDYEWKEVAFVQSWGSKKPEPDDEW